MADKEYEVQSLKSYDAQKVISAIQTFHTHCRAFDDVSVQILSVKNALQKVWKSAAADVFVEKFEVVYGQVTDIGDALYDIYNALLDAQDAFYQADDSLQQQMKQAEHNKKRSGGSGSSSGSNSGDLLDVGQHNTPDQYVPNVALPPITPLPVLQSTMDESYNPTFFYENFQQMPVIGHSVPSPVAVQMLYDSMNVKEVISHNVADATSKVFEYEAKGLLDMQEHDVPEAYVPEPEYVQMEPKEVMPHGTPDPYQPEFSYEAMNPMDVGAHDIPDANRPGFGYDGMNPHDVGQHDTPDAEQPGLGYDTMASKDVEPHGTEEAAVPELGYDAMAPKDVAPHGTEDAAVPEFVYDAMAPKDVVPHDTEEANIPEFAYDAMAPKDVAPHNVPDPYRPEFYYSAMAPLDVPTSTIGEAYFNTFLDMPASRRERLYASLSVAVMSELTKGMVHGTELATVKMNIGYLMVDMLASSSELQGAERERVAMQMGEKVFEAICGTTDAETSDAVSNLLQHPNAWTKENVNVAVNDIMNDVEIPGNMDMAIIAKDVVSCDAINQGDLVPASTGDVPMTVQPTIVGKVSPTHGSQNFQYIKPIGAGMMLGSAGTEGMDSSGLSGGMQNVADFSMKMTTVRVLGEPKVAAYNMDVDVTAFNKPVATCIPSLTETKVDCSGDTITWSLTESAKDPAQNDAIARFAMDPVSASKNSAVSATLRSAAKSSIKVTPITLGSMGAQFA